MTIRLGVPSKGRLQEATFDWFAGRGLRLSLSGQGREYAGRVEGAEGVALVLLSASEIPRELAAGRIHLGVTGQDLVAELLGETPPVAVLAPMGFGHADLVVAVPAFWADVETMDDLDAVAAAFRAGHGQRLRVATKYRNLVRRFFQRHQVADYRIVDSQGATEGTVANGTAECIADITTSGATLRDNHLKVLADGLVLQSQATLWRSVSADWSGTGDWPALASRLGVPA